jgi:DNA topoisomerase-1
MVLCTLRTDHASVRGEELKLSFVGKSGVRHERVLSDRAVSAVVRRCRELPGQELFQYVDDDGAVRSIGSGDVNAWLAQATGAAVTAKDFRTWQASAHALELTLAACLDGKTPRRPLEVLAAVAHRLGNTVAVCRKSYVHPTVLGCATALVDSEERARLLQRRWARTAPPGTRGLSVAERRLMGLLREAASRAGRSSGRGVAGLSGGSPQPQPAPGRAVSAPAGGCA